MTSKLRLWAISWQAEHLPQGVTVKPFWQFRDLARIRAQDVFPMPRGPQNRYAWARRLVSTAFLRISVIWLWPISSSKFSGRYFLARTTYDMDRFPFLRVYSIINHFEKISTGKIYP